MTVITEGVAHALIIERDQEIIMTGVTVAVAVVAENDFLLSLHPQAKVQHLQDREIRKGVAPYRDTHLQAEKGPILHQCLHPLTNDARQLTLLRTRTQSQKASDREFTRPRQTGKLRWVVIHDSSANVLPTSFPQDIQFWRTCLRSYTEQAAPL